MWTTVDFACKLECPEPQNITDATANYADKFVGSNATYSCDPETVPGGSPIITCQTDQQWSTTDFQCLKQCPVVPDVPNATTNTTVRIINTVADYVCNSGYVVDGTPQLTCQPDQMWTTVDFACKLECPEPQNITDATANYADKFVGSNATYSCDPETVPGGSPIITCQTDQQWSTTDFQCLKQCPVVPDVPNATTNTTVRIINTVADYVCNSGYVVDGTPQLTCQPDQMWTTVDFACKLECPEPQNITDATANYADKFVGSNATYSCDPETVPGGSPNITCQTDQQWSTTDFQCLKQCPVVPDVPNATTNTAVRIINTVVDYVCNSGYAVDGTPQLTCQPDQTWTSVDFACKLECPEPPTIVNATVSYPDKFVGSTATYVCVNGTASSGNPDVICEVDRTWTSSSFSCTAVK
ncbi:sushi, von Willebrand factor type A, EGF and pentraxin domain-containing protein 1 [Patella vulgata]|uniref:sushi, von Willebrand factor type A, EGF and pentraxin domain-containing protein 1 n=1 Tax=Patella vulgata TaxID=6465 RepID=UPI00218028DC|nr:sushi, von Willebrand factor type A, EGF and pentraxin domain-containing protein 1 [Patella vulgata]